MDTNLFLAETVEKCPKGIKNCVCVNLRESAVNILLKVILCELCGSTLLATLSPSKGASAVMFLKGFLSVPVCVGLRLVSYRLALFSFHPGSEGAGTEFPLEVNAQKVRGILLVPTIKNNAAIWWQWHVVHIPLTKPNEGVAKS